MNIHPSFAMLKEIPAKATKSKPELKEFGW